MVGQFQLIIFDECDTFFTRDIRDMLREFMAAGARVLGVTATPYRGRKKDSLFGFFEGCPYSYELRTAFDEGWLVGKHAKVYTHTIKSINLDTRGFSKAAADFDPVELERELMREAPLHDMANLIARYHNPRTDHAMVRCVRKNQAIALKELLSERYGLKTACVWGSQNAADRESELERFRSGEATIITNVRVLGRGVDIPIINSCFNCAPTKSKATYTQMLGRMTRTVDNCLEGCETAEERLAAIAASAKPDWVLHDMTATSRFHTPVTAIDILCRDTALVDRIKEDHGSEEEPDEFCIDDLDAEEIAERQRLDELARLEREAERERKRKLVIGVAFDSQTRDLWDAADAKTPKVQCYRFMFGKYRGRPLRDPLVTLDYLYWYLQKQTKPMWVAAVQKEIDRREKIQAEAQKEELFQ
jgi:superfamily II DNA or RNA helicase